MSFARWNYILAAVLLYFLFFYGLTRAGLLGPDEPRYASIAREMASSGDWITPRLWGEAWFEKPPLLYWMSAAGFLAGLGNELSPRLPVALTSAVFLIFFFLRMSRLFGARPAWFAAGILATSAGWMGFSHVAVTDIPMSVAFGASMLLALTWPTPGVSARILLSGALLGIAILGKGLVPLALSLPVVWLARRNLRSLAAFYGVAFLVALPWYAAVTLRHGQAFLDEFFWKHHFARLASESIQHVQPFWFFAPVLLGLVFPWTPLLALLVSRKNLHDSRRLFLLLWLAWGLLFFSVSKNKLPGYLLPLLPAAAALMGASLAESRHVKWLLPCSALLAGLLPVAAVILPEAVAAGLSRASFEQIPWYWCVPAAGIAAVAWYWSLKGRNAHAFGAVFVWSVAGIFALKAMALEPLDQRASARGLWRQISAQRQDVCVSGLHRAWRYGLNYYSIDPLPDCREEPKPLEIRQKDNEIPAITRR